MFALTLLLQTITTNAYHGKSNEYYNLIHNQPDNSLKDRFFEQYNKLITNGKQNGYLSVDGVPYYSIETLIVDEYGYVDYGHETTAQVMSAYIWLTTMNIYVTNSTADFESAWNILETYFIPSEEIQPGCDNYNPLNPSIYCPSPIQSSDYPVECDKNVKVGSDALNDELADIYGFNNKLTQIYAPHWLLDVDNIYGFGQSESGNQLDRNVMINNFQIGPINDSSIWRNIVTPCQDDFKYGGKCGFADCFYDNPPYTCEKQWNYRAAPDASSTIIQATYWAYNFTKDIETQIEKAVALSDFMRYSMFDRYFKDIPCYDDSCPAVNISSGWNATFYLIGWYWAWTGGLTNEWSFRMPSWNIHQQHQNPLSAYILSTTSAFQPKTANGKNQWKMVLNTTINFWQWLQTDKGGIASGATNSINGEYDNPIQNGVTGFFTDGLPYLSFTDSYNEETNDRFLYQAISQERNAEYCYLSDDDKACNILNNWIQWILSLNSSILLPNNEYRVPQKIQFFGQPNNYSAQFVQNSALSVEIVSYDQEIGSASVLAHALTYYAKKTGNINAKNLARELLDRMYLYVDNLGIGINETRQDYIGDVNGQGFWEPVDVPAHCYGKYPNGDNIEQGVTFIDTRSWYKNDPSWPKVEAGKTSNVAPIFIYHRFWEQAQYAIACADYVRLFGDSN